MRRSSWANIGLDGFVRKRGGRQGGADGARYGLERGAPDNHKARCGESSVTVMAQVDVLALELRDEHSNGNDAQLGALGQVLLLSGAGRVIYQVIHLHELCNLRLAVEVALQAVLAVVQGTKGDG